MLLDATYMGLIFIIVYVGAIAVLFLFVVMLINLRTLFVPYKRGIHLFFILFTFFFFSDFFLTNLVCLTDIFRFDKLYIFQQSLDLSFRAKYLVDSVALLGYTYYNFFFFYLISLGFLLLIILVGVVVLLAPALVNYISVNRTISNSVLNNRVLDEHRSIVVKY
jgi:NADH-quinone oxidoreductase subunit J